MAIKDRAKLTRKVITNKLGKRQTVWVKFMQKPKVQSIEKWIEKNKDQIIGYEGNTQKKPITIGNAFEHSKKVADLNVQRENGKLSYTDHMKKTAVLNEKGKKFDRAFSAITLHVGSTKKERDKAVKWLKEFSKREYDYIMQSLK